MVTIASESVTPGVSANNINSIDKKWMKTLNGDVLVSFNGVDNKYNAKVSTGTYKIKDDVSGQMTNKSLIRVQVPNGGFGHQLTVDQANAFVDPSNGKVYITPAADKNPSQEEMVMRMLEGSKPQELIPAIKDGVHIKLDDKSLSVLKKALR